LALTPRCAAGQTVETITVTGAGASSAWPNYAVLKGKISAKADSAAEALKSFRTLRDEVEKLAKDDSKRLTLRLLGEQIIQGGAEDVASLAMAASTGAVPDGGQATIAEEVELRIDFAGDMERAQAAESLAAVFDAAGELGVEFGPAGNALTMMMMARMAQPSLAEFRLTDAAAVEDEAYAAAIADARRKAEKLAVLAGGKLGRVVSVEEIDAAVIENPYEALIVGMQGGRSDEQDGASSPANGRIQIKKQLRVSFALAAGNEQPGE
jgi:uncharacterized protein YggE